MRRRGALAASPESQSLLAGLKQRIQAARVRAGLAVNRELALLYWPIGREILSRQQAQGRALTNFNHTIRSSA